MGDIDNSAPATPTPEHSGESTTSVASSSRRVPSVGRGFLGGVAAVCVATAVLSFVALSGGQKSSGVSDAAANSKLKAAAPAKAAAPKAAAAAPAAANAAAVQPQGAGPDHPGLRLADVGDHHHGQPLDHDPPAGIVLDSDPVEAPIRQ